MVIDHRFEEGDARRAPHHVFTVYPPRQQFAAQQRECQLETAAADDQLMMFLAALQRRRIGQRWSRQPRRRLAQMLIMPQPLAARCSGWRCPYAPPRRPAFPLPQRQHRQMHVFALARLQMRQLEFVTCHLAAVGLDADLQRDVRQRAEPIAVFTRSTSPAPSSAVTSTGHSTCWYSRRPGPGRWSG